MGKFKNNIRIDGAKKTDSKLKLLKRNVVHVNLSDDNKKKIKRLNYCPESMKNALKTMQESGLSVRKAAAAYGVPASTLHRKKHLDPERQRKKSGTGTVIPLKEEDDIVNWVLYRSQVGAPVSKSELFDCVQKLVETMKIKTPFTNDRPSRHWYEGFKKRHPNLCIRRPQHLSCSRATVTREELQEWFREIGKYLEDRNLLDISSNRYFNCDESSIMLCPDAERVLAEKGSRTVYKIVDGGREALTVLFMFSADGTRAPPMIMYPFKKDLPKRIVNNTPTGWGIGVSDSGWMTTETFYEYITNIFYLWLVKENIEFPVVVFMDNHSSHLNLPLVTFCREKQIELIMLAPNSTHIMQPLDIAFFHPFKVAWKKCVPKWKSQQSIMRIKKEDFPHVLKFTLDSMRDERNIIISGFRASGLYPFNPKMIDFDVLRKGKKTKHIVEEKNDYNLEIEDQKQFLQTIEKRLPADKLSKFKEAAISGSWTGDLEDKSLFNFWFEEHKKSTGILYIK